MENLEMVMMNGRILVSKHRSLPVLQDAVLSPESSRQEVLPEDECADRHLSSKSASKFRVLSSRLFIQVKKKLKLIKDTGSYCANVFREWVGYTFCCIITKKRKTPGVQRSVKI